jgi:cysteine desulfurase/selenocysteine lyase
MSAGEETRDTAAAVAAPRFDVDRVRADFPILARRVGGKPLVYLDSAATAQKPEAVLDAMQHFYREGYASVARGVHRLSAEATAAYEAARARVARFLGSAEADEVVFVRGTTEAMNLLAATLASGVAAGDEILVTGLEHHSNFVPWQRLAAARGARFVVADVDPAGEVTLEEMARRLTPRTRIVALAHVSNVLGSVLPVAAIARLAREAGALVVVDGAQGAPHLDFDVRDLGCDFYAFSGHKTYGPTGIGALWGRRERLAALPPYQTGGGMIGLVGEQETTWAPPPQRFEAGTPAAAEAIGFVAALDWIEATGRRALAAHEASLTELAVARLSALAGVEVLGRPRERVSVVSFVVAGAHPHDVGTVLDAEGVAVRAGHHCAQPLMRRLGQVATVRASFAGYNTETEVDVLVAAVDRARRLFA